MKINKLLPEARPCFESFLAALDRVGLRYLVLEVYRTDTVQNAYYAQGREPVQEVNRLRKLAGLYALSADQAGRIITKSHHSANKERIAADIVPVLGNGKIPWDYGKHKELWETFGRLGIEAGLEWGGTWKPLLPCGLGWPPRIIRKKDNRSYGEERWAIVEPKAQSGDMIKWRYIGTNGVLSYTRYFSFRFHDINDRTCIFM
jgi:peptidoglycan L-alanyl-D-glutamate endopeptidase CwlK